MKMAIATISSMTGRGDRKSVRIQSERELELNQLT